MAGNNALGASYAVALRRELAERNRHYAETLRLPHSLTYGEDPVVVYEPFAEVTRHGNFLDASYSEIVRTPGWAQRLRKVHTSGRRSLPRNDRGFWCELDSSNSSDALLMNIFCHPEVRARSWALSLLDVEPGNTPEFGVKARVPLASGRFDRTEIDMRFGPLLAEAKLTEADFQSKQKSVVHAYRDFEEVFHARNLPQTKTRYLGYQLIRNVLAAHASESSFCVFIDARRPDLLESWFSVMRAVRPHHLRLRCKVLTWQELSEALPEDLREFLALKYGVVPR